MNSIRFFLAIQTNFTNLFIYAKAEIRKFITTILSIKRILLKNKLNIYEYI
jgi:hypothetical protein